MCNCLECEYSERAAYGGKQCLTCYKEIKPDTKKLFDEIEKSIRRQRFIGKFRNIKEATKHKDCADGVTALTSRFFYVRVSKTWEKLCRAKEIIENAKTK